MKLFSVRDLAEATGYTRQQIYNQIKNGNIKVAQKWGRFCLLSGKECQKVLDLSREKGKYKVFRRVRAKKQAES